MALFVLTCIDKPDALDLRMATRQAHLDWVDGLVEHIKVAGPFLDEAGQMIGSMFVLEFPDLASVQAFSAADPYVQAGVFESVEIRPFRVTRGGFA